LVQGLADLTWQEGAMILAGCLLIYLGIKKKYEPMLLIPLGVGALLANIPFSSAIGDAGWLTLVEKAGVVTELFPVMIFIALGAMCDFSPMLSNPLTMLYGAAAQFGIFVTVAAATLLGFNLHEAAAIGIIGAADGPTTIFVASHMAREILAPVTVCAYSYMSLVPIIQPPIVKLCTTEAERKIWMKPVQKPVSKTAKIAFPIVITIVAGLINPVSVALLGALMFGNLLRECGATEKLVKSAQNELANLVTLLLGIAVGSTMQAEIFLTWRTLGILALGATAFAFDTASAVLLIRFLNLFRREKINPILGAAGVSCFPMSARVAARMAQEANPNNYLIMHAVGATVAGIISCVMAGGILMAVIR
jgi:oxaloacetate decarboxylase beta subunit